MYCSTCGNQIEGNEKYCPYCGAELSEQKHEEQNPNGNLNAYGGYQNPYGSQPKPAAKKGSGLQIAAKVLLILGTIINAYTSFQMDMFIGIITLAYCIPLTVTYFVKTDKGETVGTGFKVACLILVSLLGGIFMLCDKEQ